MYFLKRREDLTVFAMMIFGLVNTFRSRLRALKSPLCDLHNHPTGIHYIGELLDHKPFRCMLDQMTNGQLEWEPLENPFDHVVLGPPENRRWYPIYSGRTRFTDELKKCFPGEEKAIDEFMKLAKVESQFSLCLCNLVTFISIANVFFE